MKRKLFLSTALCTAALLTATAQREAGIWVCSTEGRYWDVRQTPVGTTFTGTPQVRLRTDRPQQTFRGWGTCFNERGWQALNLLNREEQEEIMQNLFAPAGQLRLGIGRIPLGANDYALEWYSCSETEGDFAMEHFNIDRDKRILIPYIHMAQQYNKNLTFWASPWSPPTWMKTNKHYANRSGAGNGLPADQEVPLFNDQVIMQADYLQAYALYFSKFVKAYAAENIPITQVMYQNEAYSFTVYPGCSWTTAGTVRFNRDYLGPLFRREHPDVEVVMGTMNTARLDVFDEILGDEKLREYVSAVGYQWEGARALPEVRRKYPQLRAVQTESECGSGTFDWGAAEHTFGLVNHYLNYGCDTYTYWNGILKDNGSSTWGWLQNALIRVNSTDRTYTYTPEYYALMHNTHFVPAGSRVLTSDKEAGQCLAFETPEGHIVLTVANTGSTPMRFSAAAGERYLDAELPARSFNTFVLADESDALSLLCNEYGAADLRELPQGTAAELTKALQEARALKGSTDAVAVHAAWEQLGTLAKQLTAGREAHARLTEALALAEAARAQTGDEGLAQAVQEARNLLTAAGARTADYERQTEALLQALQQNPAAQTASKDRPADCTYYIQSPAFHTGDTPDSNRGTAAGWHTDNRLNNGGDIRLNFIAGRNCWNSWSNDFRAMNLYQDLAGLAPGLYRVSCCAMLGTGEITDQHAYAASSLGTAVSPVMTVDNGWNTEAGWERLTTDYALVGTDGRLRIGMASTSPGGTTAGWFCVTDFGLHYCGQDESAFRSALETRRAEAAALAEAPMLATERTALERALEQSRQTPDFDAVLEALEQLNAAVEAARSSAEARSTYAAAQTDARRQAEEAGREAAEWLEQLMEEQQTRLETDTASRAAAATCTAVLKAVGDYLPVRQQAAACLTLETLSADGRQQLEALLERHDAVLPTLTDGARLVPLARELQEQVHALLLTQAPSADTEFTFLIQNPDGGNGNNYEAPEGWYCRRENGNTYVISGEHYSGDGTNKYFDSWNPVAGALGYTLRQTLEGLPNGTYKVTCRARTSGNGACILAETAEGTVKREIPNYGNTGGEIWQQAPAGSAERQANGGQGFGWSALELAPIRVSDNRLTLGFSNEPFVTGEEWTGTWFSVDDFRLFYVGGEEADGIGAAPAATDWYVIVQDRRLIVRAPRPYSVYTAAGRPVSTTARLQPGLYLVCCGGQARKVIVK